MTFEEARRVAARFADAVEAGGMAITSWTRQQRVALEETLASGGWRLEVFNETQTRVYIVVARGGDGLIGQLLDESVWPHSGFRLVPLEVQP